MLPEQMTIYQSLNFTSKFIEKGHLGFNQADNPSPLEQRTAQRSPKPIDTNIPLSPKAIRIIKPGLRNFT